LRIINPLLILGFVVVSAFVTADIASTLGRAALYTPPAFAIPTPVKRPPRPAPPPSAAAAPQAPPVVAPSVRLIGTATGSYPFAVILVPGVKEQQIFRLRDDVGGGWIVSAIRNDRIVLKHGGHTAVIELSFAAAPPQSQAPQSVVVAVPASPSGIRLDPREVEGALSDLNKVVTQARAVPFLVNGKITGYTIFDIAPGSFYTKLGLQNNDVVERVNGVEIKSPDALYQLFQQIRTERRVALDFSRNGKRETVTIDIR